MLRTIILVIALAACGFAGPLNVASYPVRHPKKVGHATVKVLKVVPKVVKALVW